MRIRYLCVPIVLILAVSASASAQTDRANLQGTITDQSGATVAGADVQATQTETGISQIRASNSRGYYLFPGLPVGNYVVSVSKDGFATRIVNSLTLRVGEDHGLDIQLQVGGTSQKIEVSAQTEPVERSSPAMASVVGSDQIANLPTNGRDWANLTILAPFAQDDGGGDQRTIRFAGRARDDNNFSIDGVDAGGIQEQAQKSSVRLQISEDAVEEYRVNSALYDTEYGTQAGGQVNVVTKSGTNDYHGTVFGYLRNSYFDARNFNDFDANGNPVILPFRMGQFGLTLGGPIQKNKSFFFISYEGLRQQQDDTTRAQTFVPSPSLVQAILVSGRNGQGPTPSMCAILQGFPWRSSAGTIGNCTPSLVYPDSAFTNCSLPTANCGITPDANDPLSDVEEFTHPIITKVNEDSWLARFDHKFSDKTLFYARAQRDVSVSYSQINVSSTGLDSDDVYNHPANYLLALEHTFTSTLFNESKFYINRSPFHNPHGSTLDYGVNTNLFAGIPNVSADIEVGTTYGVVDNATWTHGRSTFKMGMEYRRVRLNQGQTADNNLTFGDDQSLVSGTLSGIQFNAPWCCHRLRRNFLMPYFQDEWKFSPTLTLTAGVRYEYYGVPFEATDRTTVFDFNQFHGVCVGTGSNNGPFPSPINTPACPSAPGLTNPDYRDVDPRVGIAWAPSRLDGKTVVRAGFGIYHGAAQNDDLNAGLESDTFRVVVNQSVPFQPAYAQEIPDLSGLPTGKTPNHPRALQRQNRRNLYVEDWGLTVEQAIPQNFIFSASYLGSHGVRLFSRGAVNLCSIPVTLNGDGSDCVRPLDQYFPEVGVPGGTTDPYGSVDYKSDIGASTYHALGLSLERHFNNGFSLLSRYTWSHSINDGSVGGGESNGPENVNCLKCDNGPSVFDIRNNFITDAVYQLPFGEGGKYLNDSGVVGKILGGWQFSGVGMWHTGHPLTVNMDLNTNPIPSGPFAGFAPTYLLPDGNDQTTQRPDVVPGVSPTMPGGGRNGIPLINPAAFQAPPVDANGNFTRYGNESNGMIRALPSWQIDMGLQKDTKLTERFTLEFAVQAFNIFNHIQLGDPGQLTLIYNPASASTGFLDTPPGFGVITSTVNFNSNNDNDSSPNTGTGLPRQIQFMLRVKF
ncbi:MAG TPA: TonB-dependent receptor [Candidatus Acidoferrales bacterium]|nr:TonB-dependent receptor [Candidatus Acidoferrales bacterium]